jgi:hypothetical protein
LASSTRLVRLTSLHLINNRIGVAGAKALEQSAWSLNSKTGRFERTVSSRGHPAGFGQPDEADTGSEG